MGPEHAPPHPAKSIQAGQGIRDESAAPLPILLGKGAHNAKDSERTWPPRRARCYRTVTGDIDDIALLENLSATCDFDAIYHIGGGRSKPLRSFRRAGARRGADFEWPRPAG